MLYARRSSRVGSCRRDWQSQGQDGCTQHTSSNADCDHETTLPILEFVYRQLDVRGKGISCHNCLTRRNSSFSNLGLGHTIPEGLTTYSRRHSTLRRLLGGACSVHCSELRTGLSGSSQRLHALVRPPHYCPFSYSFTASPNTRRLPIWITTGELSGKAKSRFLCKLYSFLLIRSITDVSVHAFR